MRARAQFVPGRGIHVEGEDAEKGVALLASNRARHEAAHAVVAAEVGLGVELVTLRAEDTAGLGGDGLWGGAVKTVFPPVLPSAAMRAAVKLAGPVADEIAGVPLSLTLVPCGGVSDWDEALLISGLDDPNIPADWSRGVLVAALDIARTVLEQQAGPWARVAAALEERGRLTGADLKAIFEAKDNVVSFTTSQE